MSSDIIIIFINAQKKKKKIAFLPISSSPAVQLAAFALFVRSSAGRGAREGGGVAAATASERS